nr:retrovirus-related Pol polyprotein from transposon TNT 1-94 [Tanacetum cinerariifolium]
MNPWGGNAAGYGEAQNRAQENGVALDAEQLLFLVGGPDNAFDDDVDEQLVQDLALNMDNMFQAEDCDAFDSDAQPALYNGHEILKDNHARAKVHNTDDTLEIAEITRKKMNAKMTDPECVTHKVKIAPHDYSKENLLVTFTPQKQLTPEQI